VDGLCVTGRKCWNERSAISGRFRKHFISFLF